jgi:hypothetical protein
MREYLQLITSGPEEDILCEIREVKYKKKKKV